MSTPQTSQPISQPVQQPSSGFGGDLLGFGGSSTPTPPQPVVQQPANLGFGADLMGFGISSPQPPQPVSQPVNLGFNFGAPSTPVVSQPPQTQPQNNFGGMNLLGNSPQPTISQQPALSSNTGFKPIINTNPNKFLAYENQHIQIWMDCIK